MRSVATTLLRRALKILSAWDTRTLRGILSLMHLGFASTCFIRPHLFELYPTWQGFQSLGDPTAWGLTATIIAIGLLFSNSAGLTLLLAEVASVVFFLVVTLQISAYTGYNTGTPTYALFAVFSLVVLFSSAASYMERQPWFQRLKTRVDTRRGLP